MEVVVKYVVFETFKVPEGINLEDESQVEDWEVKYNILTIYMVDGTEHEIDSEGFVETFDYKRPVSTEIVDRNAINNEAIESEDESDEPADDDEYMDA
jgi:hypothetical protein